MTTAITKKLRSNAVNTGKLSSKINYIRAMLNDDGREDETTLTDDVIGDALTKLPGNIGDDAYVTEVLAILTSVENPSEALQQQAGLSAAPETEAQYILARKTGEAFDTVLIDTMEEDIEAGKQAKEGPFHTLDNLERLFGDKATSNEFKNTISKWPLVDSEDTKEHPLVPRFDGDMPAKYKHFNVASSKHEDRDFYFLQFDASPLGRKINDEINNIDKAKNNASDATEPFKSMPGSDLTSRRLELVKDKNEGRKQLKRAMKVFFQLQSVNACDKIVAKLVRDDKGNLKRPDPIYMYEPDATENNKRCDLSTFLSYVPNKVDNTTAGLKELLATKPTKAPSGKTKGDKQTTSDDVGVPKTVTKAESFVAGFLHYMNDRSNRATYFTEGKKNKELRTSTIELYLILKDFYNVHKAEYEREILKDNQQAEPKVANF